MYLTDATLRTLKTGLADKTVVTPEPWLAPVNPRYNLSVPAVAH
jgi:hypothetical protein